jgi:hypothetical protein
MSAGTMIALGAKEIVMLNHESFLGKVDPGWGETRMVHVLKAVDQIKAEKNANGKRSREVMMDLSDRMQVCKAMESKNELNIVMALLGLTPKLEEIIKEHFIYSELPHEHRFDFEMCRNLGLQVRNPNEDELKYFE